MATPAALADCDYRRRSERLRERLDGRTMVVSNPSNIRWLTGFGGSLGWVVVAPERTTLVTDGRYEARAATDIATAGIDADVAAGRTRADVTALLVAAATRSEPVLAEAEHLTHAAWLALAADLDLEPSGPVVQELRRVKDAGEVARMARAASIADRALVDTAPLLDQRPTEADVRDALESRMRTLGADGPSYATIVASGPAFAARPHHETGRRTIVEGDTVIVDVGALVDGYHSDMTRSFVVGRADARAARRLRLRPRGPGGRVGHRPCRRRRRRRRCGMSRGVPRRRPRGLVPPRHRARGRARHPRGAVRLTGLDRDPAGGGRGDRRTGPLS